MELFSTLGLALLGLFTTVILSGVLAGIVAFGIIESGFRKYSQRWVIWKLVDAPTEVFMKEHGYRLFDMESQLWQTESMKYLENLIFRDKRRFRGLLFFSLMRIAPWSRFSVLPSLVRIEPTKLFGLPYRQLCGQIANGLSAESNADSWESDLKSERTSYGHPLTLALAVAGNLENYELIDTILTESPAVTRTRALSYLDSIQIALANSVLATVRYISLIMVAIVFSAILFPNVDALNSYLDSPSFIARNAGGIIALVTILIIVASLAFAAAVVSSLTFRWIDRFASAR